MKAPVTLEVLIREANEMVVFTGAGVSTGSGIPDYRGPKGLWKVQQPVYYDAFMSSHEARVRYWAQKADGWRSFRDAEPNAVHRALVELERAGKLHMLVTQNIDGLHAKAGTSPERLVEIHGTNREVACQTCGERSAPDGHFEAFEATGEPPRCPCGGWLKPATISFGQALEPETLERAFGAAQACDLMVALGSTLSVHPAASVPLVALQRGVPYVIVNSGATDHDGLPGVTLRLEGDVSSLVPNAIVAALTTPWPLG